MDRVELVGGMVLFLVPAAAAAVVTWQVLTRRLSHLDALERVAAGWMVFVAAVMAIHLAPLIFGVLERTSVVVASVVAAAAAFAIPRGAEAGDPVRSRPAGPPSGRLSTVLAGGVATAVLVAVAVNTREWLPKVFRGVDTMTFHLPNAASWMHSGSMWQIDQFLPLQIQGYYPSNGELLQVWAMLPFDNEFLVRPVFVALLFVWAVSIFALGRELGVSRAAGVLAACALVTIPTLALSTVPRAMPDVILYAAVTTGLLFLLRHGRSAQRSDLVLAGLGLGLGLGTKWYGLTTAAVILTVWMGARVWIESAQWRAAAGDFVVVGAVTFAGGGIWLVRNLVEVGNPFFPVKLAPLGLTIFDAPHDSVRSQVGFSIAHYLGQPDELWQIVGEILDGAGVVVPVAAVLVIVALVVARRLRDHRILTLAGAAAVLAAVYVVTPYTALGVEGDPSFAEFNTRYLVPAMVCAVIAGAWMAGRTRLGALVEPTLAVVALSAVSDAYGPLRFKSSVATLVVVAAVAGGAVLLWRRARDLPTPRRRGAVAVAAVTVGAAAAIYMSRVEERFNAVRYAPFDPVFRVIEGLGDGGFSVGLANEWSQDGPTPVWPSFGPRGRNEVRYVGYFDRGFLTQYDSSAPFGRALRSGRYDLVIVGRGLRRPLPRVPEQSWTTALGYREIVRSRRLILYASPAFAPRLR